MVDIKSWECNPQVSQMSEWFYGKEGQQFGPVDETTLRARMVTGEVGPSDLVWTEGMAAWQPLRELPQFSSAAPTAPFASSESQDDGPPPSEAPFSPYAPPTAGLQGASYHPGPSLPSTNGLAIASLVCGILSLVLFCLYAGIYLGIPAVICGHISLGQFKNPGNAQTGRGLAIAGLICGYLGIAIFAFLIIMIFTMVSSAGFYEIHP